MRVLHFEPDSYLYEDIYTSVITPRPRASRAENKIHGTLCDKLEAIGQVKPAIDLTTGKPREHQRDEVRYYISVDGGRVVLEDAEWTLAKQCVEAVIPQCHPALSRRFEAAMTFLEGIAETKPDALVAEPNAVAVPAAS